MFDYIYYIVAGGTSKIKYIRSEKSVGNIILLSFLQYYKK